MPSKIYFMPYDPAHPKENIALYEYHADGFTGDSGADIGYAKNRHSIAAATADGYEATEVWWDGSESSSDLQVRASTTDDQLLIRGHGYEDDLDFIEGGRSGERVKYDEVANRIHKAGLPEDYKGQIVCYSCHLA